MLSKQDEALLREKAQPGDHRSIPLFRSNNGNGPGERTYLAELPTGESVVYTMIGRRVRVDHVHPHTYLHGVPPPLPWSSNETTIASAPHTSENGSTALVKLGVRAVR